MSDAPTDVQGGRF